MDAAFRQAYAWLSEAIESGTATSTNRENLCPRADAQLVKLFKSVTDQGVVAKDDEIIAYIREVGTHRSEATFITLCSHST